jgi:hypothetical protein
MRPEYAQLLSVPVVLGVVSRIAKWAVAPMLLALLGILGVGQASAQHNAVPVCGASDRHFVVARDDQAMVYRTREPDLEFYGYWGCVYGSKRSVRLGIELISGSAVASFGVGHVTLAGTTAAYELTQSHGMGEYLRSQWYVAVANLRTGRILRKVPTGVTSPLNRSFVGDGPVTAIQVKSDGSVAWILDTVQTANRYQIHALDMTGERVLAIGSDIAPDSLALAGNTLYWTQRSTPMSATLD